MAKQDCVDRRLDGRRGRRSSDFEIDDLVLKPNWQSDAPNQRIIPSKTSRDDRVLAILPFSEPAHALRELASGLKFWVCDSFDSHAWYYMAYQCA